MKLLPGLIIFLFYSASSQAQVDRTANFSKERKVTTVNAKKENVWIFLMAGQSNMAGRGFVEPEDTIPNERILSINKEGELIVAKEPLHFYEPNLTGLDCGVSFANNLLSKIPKNVTILMIPVAIGGSSISQWLGDSLYRGVKLFSNFSEKVVLAKKYGTIKGILWHQGESDANDKNIPLYKQRLNELFTRFRNEAGNNQLPVLIGELGSYSENKNNWSLINTAINKYSETDKQSAVITTNDLIDKGDHIHFNSEGQREIGRRFAEAFLKKFYIH